MLAPMRALVLCGLIACGSSSAPELPPDSSSPSCGDGVCEASEVGACVTDCGAAVACGDNTCSGGETSTTCPNDCPPTASCGDGTCTDPETEATCPDDCGTGVAIQCGNLVCEGDEALTCPTDCATGGGGTCPGTGDVDCVFCWVDPTTCVAPQTEQVCEECLGLGGGDSPCNVDGVCDPELGEDEINCPSDCP
jgi:hypothetical protein